MGKRERRLARLAAQEANIAQTLPVVAGPVTVTSTRPTDLTANKGKVPYKPQWLQSSSMSKVVTPMFKGPAAPTVLYTEKAWAKIQYLVKQAVGEVGWIGLVDKRADGNYIITDVFVPKQLVTGTTTNIDAQAINKLITDLITSGVYNDNMLYWGHSHVHMQCSPSTTDEEQVQEYIESMEDTGYYIRGIYNKRGESKVDVYVKEAPGKGWVFQCVDNYVLCELSENEMNALALDFRSNVKDAPPPKYLKQKPQAGAARTPVSYKEGMSANGRFTKILAPAGQELEDELDYGLGDDTYSDVISYNDLTDRDGLLKSGME